ncbi:Gfo/Idh/MocA family protein [Candidatus Solirubrobacter pratensis]|uniref:Gfo/Idh/MocA family protein n=1 Tax=Candidatus Solirubrobacter pratensis TaxID=1298857 RepID=UPI000408DFBA|nr:Gfo/Idh/MocA family oxidoreductase [Candidatus Solirubrobacter pratensis]
MNGGSAVHNGSRLNERPLPDATTAATNPVGTAVIGAGYWGPNIVRNAMALEETDLKWVCDRDEARASRLVGAQSAIRVTRDIDEVLADESVEAVAIATPPATHGALAYRCIEAGRHVLVEKPLARSYAEGLMMVRAAEERGLVLHCDHTYCYTPAVQKIRDLIDAGELGTPLYYDSVRVNLGLVQQEVDVFWDLAPHDISIVDFILGSGRELLTVTAEGADPLGLGHACVGYLTLRFDDGLLAHCHLNWLSPTKIRTTIVGGSHRMVVWNDLLPAQRVSVFESGVDLAEIDLSPGEQRRRKVSYRMGSMVAPALREREALLGVLEDWTGAIRSGTKPKTDGHAGLRVLRVLEAAQASMCNGSTPVCLGTMVAPR